jgi:hypothetical protein
MKRNTTSRTGASKSRPATTLLIAAKQKATALISRRDMNNASRVLPVQWVPTCADLENFSRRDRRLCAPPVANLVVDAASIDISRRIASCEGGFVKTCV